MSGAILSVFGMGGIVLSILVWQEGGEAVGLLTLSRASSPCSSSTAGWCGASGRTSRSLLDPDLFSSKYFRLGDLEQMLQNIALGGMMIALPIYFQMVYEYTPCRPA